MSPGPGMLLSMRNSGRQHFQKMAAPTSPTSHGPVTCTMASKASAYSGATMLEGPQGEATESKRELPEEFWMFEPQLLGSSQTCHQT